MTRSLLPTWLIVLLALLGACLLLIAQSLASADEPSSLTEAERVFQRTAPAVVAVVIPPPPQPQRADLAPGAPGQPAVPEGAELRRTENGLEILVDPEKFKGDLPMAGDQPGPPPPGLRDAGDLRQLMERAARGAQAVRLRPGPELRAGFLIDGEGRVLTMLPPEFPVDQVSVEWMDGVKEDCRVAARDQVSGLCIIKSQRADLPAPLEWGDAGALRVGSTVYTVAHPEGFRNSLDVGVVAGLDRDPQHPETKERGGMIQTTFDVHPGTAGAPLLDGQGRVIAVRTSVGGPGIQTPAFFMAAPGGGPAANLVQRLPAPAPAIDLALPAAQARDVAEQLRVNGRVRRAWLGVRISDVTDDQRQQAHLPDDVNGVAIVGVIETSPADAAGLRQGDIVLAVGDQPVASTGEMVRTVQGYQPADKVTLSIWRDGERREITVVMGDQPEQL
jgi:S1-C subfamily serine protease